ncbi:voltage-dependent anion-selective channel protein 2-like isoform X1 [Lineus longissimus]|uniref:voltage-dependent anion-selective channel protein 2-like isoform X1 n=1 Tax=Lineus longissimus TaxID=88925 RepID=UPI002B4F9393
MVIPPGYGDLGKSAKDLFNKGYNYGFFKLECKTKASNGMEFTTSGNHNSDSGKLSGNLETKYKWADYGLTFTEKWNTDNVLATEVTIEDQIAKGQKLSFETSFAPNTGKMPRHVSARLIHRCDIGKAKFTFNAQWREDWNPNQKKAGKIKTGYKRDYINVNCDVDFDFAGPTVHGAGVLGYNGWLAGYQMSFDTSKSKLTKNNFGVGYAGDDFALHTSVNAGSEFAGSIHQKVNSNVETGINLSWTAGTNTTRFGIAAKYTVDKDCTLRGKVSNTGQIGLGYTQTLRDGVQLTLSALVDAKNINSGGHKLGIGLDLDAK